MVDRYALLLKVIEELNRAGSWSGNTHVQKTVNLVQSVLGREIYRFIIHHYGPYSFELKDDLERLVNSGLVERSFDEFGYHYRVTEEGLRYLQNIGLDRKTTHVIEKITTLFGKAPTYILELFSTVDYALTKFGDAGDDPVVKHVKKLKPHFSEAVIKRALEIWKDVRSRLSS